MKNYLYLLFLPIILVSCTNNEEKNGLENSVKALSSYEDKVFLILQQSGCSACLYKADQFFKDHRLDQNITYIFTGHTSEKRLKLKYNITGSESNIIIDNNSEFFRNNAQLSYPSILYFEKKSLVEYEVAGTSNFSAYDRLSDFLISID